MTRPCAAATSDACYKSYGSRVPACPACSCIVRIIGGVLGAGRRRHCRIRGMVGDRLAKLLLPMPISSPPAL